MTIKKLFFEETNHTGIQFFRSLFVGGIATVADMAVLIFLRELFGMPEGAAAVCAKFAPEKMWYNCRITYT